MCVSVIFEQIVHYRAPILFYILSRIPCKHNLDTENKWEPKLENYPDAIKMHEMMVKGTFFIGFDDPNEHFVGHEANHRSTFTRGRV